MAGLTTGLGIEVWGHELAYAWSPYGDLGSTHYFSMVLRFGEAEKARQKMIHGREIKRHRVVEGKPGMPSESDELQLMKLLEEADQGHVAQTPQTGETTPELKQDKQ